MDDYFSNTRSNDELTLREAWDNFTKGLISKEQWAETLEGVKRLRQNVPAVAETWARGTIAPIFGGTGDINELGDTTRNKLIDMLPANVGKFAKNLDAAQRLFTPAALTRHLPTTKEVLASTPRVTPKHEGAETMEGPPAPRAADPSLGPGEGTLNCKVNVFQRTVNCTIN